MAPKEIFQFGNTGWHSHSRAIGMLNRKISETNQKVSLPLFFARGTFLGLLELRDASEIKERKQRCEKSIT